MAEDVNLSAWYFLDGYNNVFASLDSKLHKCLPAG